MQLPIRDMHLDPILNLSRLLSSVYQLDFAEQITENFDFSKENKIMSSLIIGQ